MAWTSEQLKAINIRNVNAIVSAGAGSGKTAVLTARAFEIIKKKEAKVDELLILTFTNAAAHEMKDRLIAQLRKESFFAEADDVEGSQVTTFDAYSLYLVKKYNYFFDISKDVSIIDSNIVKIKEYEILEDIFNTLYDQGDQSFLDFIKTFVVKDDDVLKDYVVAILALADLKIDKEGFLNNANKEVFDVKFIDNLLEEVLIVAKSYLDDFIKMCDYFEDIDFANKIIEKINLLKSAQDYNDLFTIACGAKLVDAKNVSETDKQLKKSINDSFKELCSNIKNIGTREDVIEVFTNEQYKNAYNYLFKIAIELDKRLGEFKHRKNAYTFADIAKMALKLVDDEQINKEIKESIKFIMVDEYQDTSDIQEAFISKIANNNLFMVGDTKQSIYSFRNANCSIFQEKYEKYKQGINGEKIDLNYNFRSRQELVEDLNKIFSLLMTKNYGSVDYRIDHISKAGNTDYLNYGANNVSNHLEIYKYNSDSSTLKKAEYEAHLIAQDIVRKVNDKYLVYDAKNKNLRACKYADFAILIDKKAQFDLYKKVFDQYQFPLKTYRDEKIISSLFYDALTVILKIKNEQFDVEFKHTLIGLLRSFAYQVKDSEIYDAVKSDQLKKTKAYIDMNEIAKMTDVLPLSEIILCLYERLDIYNKLILIGDIEENQIILDHLYNVACDMQKLEYSLNDFAKYINDLKTLGIDLESSADNAVDNVVKLMTIHKSKGLEFPIVYLPSLETNFFLSNNRKSKFKTSLKYGLILPLINNNSSLNILDFLNKEDIKNKTRSERIRLIYVALTRAKEKAILLMDTKSEEESKDLRFSKSFYDFVNYYQNVASQKISEKEVDFQILTLKNNEANFDEEMEINLLTMPNIQMPENSEKEHASKALNNDANIEALNFGSTLHYILELTDFKTKDTSFINDKKIKNYIDKILSLDIFKDLSHYMIYKEYSFYDEKNEMIGVIDLLLIGESDIKIIDYKTKNIDDESYVHQLKVYQKFILEKFNKKVTTYLLSITEAKIKEIK